jgi:hypothetical protein
VAHATIASKTDKTEPGNKQNGKKVLKMQIWVFGQAVEYNQAACIGLTGNILPYHFLVFFTVF